MLEVLRHNYIPGYLRLNLRCVRWDKCKYRHLPDLETNISSSRSSHWLYRRMSALFCFYESLTKERFSENREIAIVIQTTNWSWPERHVELCRHPGEHNLAVFRETISSSILSTFTCLFARILRKIIGWRNRLAWETKQGHPTRI